MPVEPDATAVAVVLQSSLSVLWRRMRNARATGDLTLPESAALSRVERSGPATSAELARQEQISPQSMGTTLAGLEARGLIGRTADPGDGRRILLSLTRAGRAAQSSKRSARADQMTRALQSGFSAAELRTLAKAAPLLERLAEQLPPVAES